MSAAGTRAEGRLGACSKLHAGTPMRTHSAEASSSAACTLETVGPPDRGRAVIAVRRSEGRRDRSGRTATHGLGSCGVVAWAGRRVPGRRKPVEAKWELLDRAGRDGRPKCALESLLMPALSSSLALECLVAQNAVGAKCVDHARYLRSQHGGVVWVVPPRAAGSDVLLKVRKRVRCSISHGAPFVASLGESARFSEWLHAPVQAAVSVETKR